MKRISSLAACLVGALVAAVGVAADGAFTVVVPASVDDVQRTAADELRAYLSKSSGRPVAIVEERAPTNAVDTIYLGNTAFAAAHGIDFKAFADEEWLCRGVDGALVIGGGGRRGALYGVYHFLEDELGVHWFSPSVEVVPERRDLKFAGVDRHGRPAMRYRDIYFVSGPNADVFLARNRMNTESPRYGGRMRYSRAATNHSLYRYLGTPDEVRALYKVHPDWFPLIDGERRLDPRANSASKTQLCLTNPDLRRHFIARLRSHIASDRDYAAKRGIEPPMFYAIDQNDCYDGFCRCPGCAAVIEREGGTSGLLLEFANVVAEALESEAPEATFQMMAYFSTERPPRTVRPRRNVGIRLCDPASDLVRPWSDQANGWMRGNLEAWHGICDKIAVWDYQITYGWVTCTGYPTPNERTFASDLRLLAAKGGDGLFFEHEGLIGADMRDMKVWLEMKLVEDPSLDAGSLIRQFTDGFYGPAGRHIRRYRDLVARAADKKGASICWFPAFASYDFIDDSVMAEAEAIFADAARSVAEDAERSERVAHARMSLDKLLAMRGDGLAAARYRKTYLCEATRRIASDKKRKADVSKNVDKFLACAAKFRSLPVPKRFADVPVGRLRLFHAGRGFFDGLFMQCVEDGGSSTGEAVRFVASAVKDRLPGDAAKLDWPFRCAVASPSGRDRAEFVCRDALDGVLPGYGWYKIAGGARLSSSSQLLLFTGYRLPLAGVTDGVYDIYASIRILGPDVVRNRTAARGNIYLLDQIAVVRVDVEGL